MDNTKELRNLDNIESLMIALRNNELYCVLLEKPTAYIKALEMNSS